MMHMPQQSSPPSKIFSVDELIGMLTLMITERGIQASANDLFRGAVFGRDSLWTARFLIDREELARMVLVSLAQTQGRSYVPAREEEPGKMAHEFRLSSDPSANKEILDLFSKVYGEAVPGAYIIYPTVDATPLWVVLLGEYCERHGTDILDESVQHISGEQCTMRETFRRSLDWIERSLKRSKSGFLEAVRHNNGSGAAEFHVLRDGKTSYRHEDGKYPNLKDPIAYLEVQGYTYDALVWAAKLFSPIDQRRSKRLARLARNLRNQTLFQFWQKDRDTFAAALDYHPESQSMRPLNTLSTVQPEILGTGIFDELPQQEREQYIHGVLKNFFTPEFMTPIGPRSVALRYDHLTPYYAYQWSRTVWPVLSHLVARGLYRQGFRALAYDLSARMVNGIQVAGSPREFFHVTPEGSVAYDPEGRYLEGGVEEIPATNSGEAEQTWTIAALVEAKQRFLTEVPAQTPFERELLGGDTTRLLEADELPEVFSKRLRVVINIEKARELEAALVAQISV